MEAAGTIAGTTAAPLRVLLADPPLFTAPYDAALTAGLAAAGVDARWAVRRLRDGEEADLPQPAIALSCYRMTDGARRRPGRLWKAAKGIEHALDIGRIAREAADPGYDLVHVQWAALPRLDAGLVRRIARRKPVVLTVHDTTPFNGADVSPLQTRGFDALLAAPDHLVVHTGGARDALIARGVAPARITIVPHGPLGLRAAPRPVADKPAGRWRIVLFGRLQSYKGVDVLVEALGLLPAAARDRLEVIVTGDPLIDLEPIRARAAALGLGEPLLRIRPGRLSDQAMADLLGSADTFVFPYRAIEASGVLFLVAGLGKWIVASALGAFADAIGKDGGAGALVPPGDAAALARAIEASIGRVPARAPAGSVAWAEIGERTAALYRRLIDARRAAA